MAALDSKRVGPRVDDAQAELLAAEGHQVAGAFGGVFEHELRRHSAVRDTAPAAVAAAEQRRFVPAPVAAADVHADPHAAESRPRPG